MPLQSNNIVMSGLRGAFGKQVVFRQRNGKTFVSAYPDMSNRILSPKQMKVNELMKEATQYAKGVIADENLRKEAQLRFDLPSNRIYTALIREHFQKHKEAQNQNL